MNRRTARTEHLRRWLLLLLLLLKNRTRWGPKLVLALFEAKRTCGRALRFGWGGWQCQECCNVLYDVIEGSWNCSKVSIELDIDGFNWVDLINDDKLITSGKDKAARCIGTILQVGSRNENRTQRCYYLITTDSNISYTIVEVQVQANKTV